MRPLTKIIKRQFTPSFENQIKQKLKNLKKNDTNIEVETQKIFKQRKTLDQIVLKKIVGGPKSLIIFVFNTCDSLYADY